MVVERPSCQELCQVMCRSGVCVRCWCSRCSIHRSVASRGHLVQVVVEVEVVPKVVKVVRRNVVEVEETDCPIVSCCLRGRCRRQ